MGYKCKEHDFEMQIKMKQHELEMQIKMKKLETANKELENAIEHGRMLQMWIDAAVAVKNAAKEFSDAINSEDLGKD